MEQILQDIADAELVKKKQINVSYSNKQQFMGPD